MEENTEFKNDDFLITYLLTCFLLSSFIFVEIL